MDVVIAYKPGADKLKNLELIYLLLTSNGSFALNIKPVHCRLKLLFLLEEKVMKFHAYIIGEYLMDIKMVERNTSYAQNLSEKLQFKHSN